MSKHQQAFPYGADIIYRRKGEMHELCEENVPWTDIESTIEQIRNAGLVYMRCEALSVNTRLCRMENSAEL